MTDRATTERTVRQLAEALGETEPAPLVQIRRIVRRFGPEQALSWLAEAQAVEAAGGMLLPDGSRRRTMGGVSCLLVRRASTPEDRAAKKKQQQGGKPKPPAPPQEAAPDLPPLLDAERVRLIRELRQEMGTATSVNVTLIGRPGRIVEKKDRVLTTMANDRPPTFPKGLPAPPMEPTSYTVSIAAKQWRSVAEAVQNEEDALIVEGWAAYDAELEGVAVWATSCTTKALQRAKRAATAPGS